MNDWWHVGEGEARQGQINEMIAANLDRPIGTLSRNMYCLFFIFHDLKAFCE